MIARTMCVARVLGLKFGAVDMNANEMIMESFSLKEYGGMGLSVPYYIIASNNTAYHL